MKIITIRLPHVEAAMLLEVQKRNKSFRDISSFLSHQVRQDYERMSRDKGFQVIL